MPNDLIVDNGGTIDLSVEELRTVQAVSPTASVEANASGALLTVHDLNGTTTAQIYNGESGQDGADGEDGADGVSPSVSVSEITGGHRVAITDADGTETFDVMDGAPGTDGVNGADGADGVTYTPTVASNGDLSWSNDGGKTNPSTVNIKGPQGGPGPAGEDGFTPTIDVSKIGNTTTIDITNKTGTVSTSLHDGTDGQDGEDGEDGVSPTVEVENVTGGHKVTITDADGPHVFYVMDGAVSVADVKVNGASVVTNGVANISAPKTESVSGSTPSITAMAGVRYVCGEVATLDITLPASGCVDVIFESGSTPTVLTITPPTGVTVRWANGFDPTVLEANAAYEIRIINGRFARAIKYV